MNVTELARKLKIPTSELKDLLPQLGFDVGQKAIKVDNKVAEKIIEKFNSSSKLIEKLRRGEAEDTAVVEETVPAQKQSLSIPSVITVRDFAAMLKLPVASVIKELMKNGILANLNEQIDYETASIIAQDFNFQTVQLNEQEKSDTAGENKIEELLKDDPGQTVSRPPVIVVMGHVDHGKTQLLDTIRKTSVMAKESGGITQHIGAYQLNRHGRLLTFIDTPGHEAFTTMRSRGARIADIAILVIAADDGVMPQTEEVIKIIANAKLPFLVAINKIDKPEADIEKVKQQLAQKNLLPEDWGGKVICVPVSAKTGKGLDDLLEHLLLLADMEKGNIQGNPNRSAIGTIIESHLDKGEGPVATVIIQTGLLKQGEMVQVGRVVGKIKAMKNYLGELIKEAPPSTPAKILGLKDSPQVGDILQIIGKDVSLKKMVKKIEIQHKLYRDKQKWQTVQQKEKKGTQTFNVLNIILKTDMLGSQEALTQSLEVLQTESAKITIIKKGLGNINDKDVLLAENSKAQIFGFNVKADPNAQEMSREKNIPLNIYAVIYDLLDHVKKELAKLVIYKKEVVELGRAKVLAIFRTEKKSAIVGSLITKGKAEIEAKVRIIRENKNIGEGTIKKLQQAKEDAKSIPAGTECGIQIHGTTDIAVGDFLEMYKEEIISTS